MADFDDLIAPYTGRPGVAGVYLIGSGSRPYRDPASDYDFEIVIDDEAYDGLSDGEKRVRVTDPGQPGRVTHEFYLRSWSELAGLIDSTRDVDHFPFQHARLLFDPRGRLATLLAELGRLPEKVRQERSRAHYLEFWLNAGRSRKCFDRGDDLNTRLVSGGAIAALVKLLFIIKGSWPSARHWTSQELRILGIPDDLVRALRPALAEPQPSSIDTLQRLTDAWLDESGATFHHDKQALLDWGFLTPDGRAVLRKWS